MPNYKVLFLTGNYQEAKSGEEAIKLVIQRIKDGEISEDDFVALEEEANAS